MCSVIGLQISDFAIFLSPILPRRGRFKIFHGWDVFITMCVVGCKTESKRSDRVGGAGDLGPTGSALLSVGSAPVRRTYKHGVSSSSCSRA